MDNLNHYTIRNKNTIQDEETPDILHQADAVKQGHRIFRRFIMILACIGLLCLFIRIDMPVTGTACIIPSQLLAVQAVEPGVIEHVHLSSGNKAEKGQLIATLGNNDLVKEKTEAKLQMNVLRKKLIQADRSRNYLRIIFNNYEELYTDTIISRSEFEKAKLDYTHSQQEYNIYQDEIQSLRAKLDYYNMALNNLKVSAPISGVILTEIENKLGTYVKQGDEICQIANMDNYLLEFPINEKFIDAVSIDTRASIHFPAFPRIRATGTITKIQHNAWEKVKKVLVIENVINVYIKPIDLSLPVKPGMTAYVKIHSGGIHLRWSTIHFLKELFHFEKQ